MWKEAWINVFDLEATLMYYNTVSFSLEKNVMFKDNE